MRRSRPSARNAPGGRSGAGTRLRRSEPTTETESGGSPLRHADSVVRGRLTDDSGSASLEFVTAGLILLLPLVYLILTVATVQAAAFATEGTARQAARVFVRADSEAAGRAAVDRAVRIGL